MTNEELCERVLPKQERIDVSVLGEYEPRYQAKYSYEDAVRMVRQALTQGILIPAEKMLTVEEIKKTIEKMAYPDIKFPEMIAKAIHQASRQKAGL